MIIVIDFNSVIITIAIIIVNITIVSRYNYNIYVHLPKYHSAICSWAVLPKQCRVHFYSTRVWQIYWPHYAIILENEQNKDIMLRYPGSFLYW